MQGSTDLTVTGAEDTVRLYVAALTSGEGEAACALLADDFEAALLDGEQARQLDADTCPEYVAALAEEHSRTDEPFAFEGRPIREPADAEALEFKTEIEAQLGDPSATSATVRGEKGTITFRLDASSGRWEIAEIVEGG